MKKIAGYCRLSVEDAPGKEESNSIKNQKNLIRQYIEGDIELSRCEYQIFVDDGFSGSNMNRPALQKMLKMLHEGELGVVIVKDISRFSRNYIELGTYMERIFPLLGIRFISITDSYDSISPLRGIELAFKGILMDYYCKEVSFKVRSALEIRKKSGKYAMALTPFGYTRAESDRYRLVIVPREAKVVKYIFELFLDGGTYSSISRLLNEKNILTPAEYKLLSRSGKEPEPGQKKSWYPATVKNILVNRNYTGDMVYNKRSANGSAYDVYTQQHEPIIDEVLFRQVQERIFGKQ